MGYHMNESIVQNILIVQDSLLIKVPASEYQIFYNADHNIIL